MKSIRIIAAAMIILAAISCKKDETLRNNNVTMGNVVDGMFVSDQGNIFNVVENPCKGDILAAERSLVVCDVLNRTKGGESNEYDIRLNRITDFEQSPAGSDDIQHQQFFFDCRISFAIS